jgi:hypothetical protein
VIASYGEAAVVAVPDCIYATTASFGPLGLQAWANRQPLQAHSQGREVLEAVPEPDLGLDGERRPAYPGPRPVITGGC